jgi:hypothetical protein
MDAVDRFNEIKAKIPADVAIVAVSKTKPAALIQELYKESGHKMFGENKVQELEAKHQILPSDINWHFIGHLQTNKIRYIAPYVGLIQSVDSFRLLREINKEALKCKRVIPCLLQFHIAREEAKFGFSFDEANQMLGDRLFRELSNISIDGVMGMATYTTDSHLIRAEFTTLVKYYHALKAGQLADKPEFKEVSMGMSDDYLIAIEEGSTLVRIGSGIFGDR